ncbi:FG-GAP-like repeat-containing protein [Winogradskyella flava]|uniref:VCBS repeat-containing protein n=1 Tax=Winogradskyella flava TaxID=1884876 RepID=A0A842J0M9_9FLAO|nr:FG-GAP-like repeat-containing protein [Winogradskyella flava]MBC2846528.1 VCBS repeat-containing protein [Winogradskyella flava]
MIKRLLHRKSLGFYIVLYVLLTFTLHGQTFEHIETLAGLGALEKNNGVAVADYDGDNDLDIFVVANAIEDSSEYSSFSRLLRNNNNGSFTDVTEAAGFTDLLTSEDEVQLTLAQQGYKFSASWGDYDNDGFPDLFLTYSLKVQLWRNLGDGTFINVTEASGFETSNDCLNIGATWFDYNNDGFLDIYVTDWSRCDSNSMHRNNGNGTFTEVTEALGLTEVESNYSYTPFPFDFNNDGWMDFLVTNDLEDANYLYINQSGASFIEDAQSYGLDSMIDDMGIAIGNFDLDNDFDFFITGIDENALLENNGSNNYSETSVNYGINATGWAWGARFVDFDLDGDEDLFITNGYDFEARGPEQNVYYRNLHGQGQNMFEDASSELGLNENTESVESTDFDYDNDGDMDLLITNGDGPVIFYENKLLNFDDAESTLNWFKVQLQGTTSNRDAIGTILTLTTNSGSLKRYYSGVGFLSQSLQGVHFGLGDINQINTLEIKWPSGLVETFNDLDTNNTVRVIEGQGLEVLDIEPSQKIYGCTDPVSCSYDPDATVDNGSCSYITSQDLLGNTSSSFLRTETYTYNASSGSNLLWEVSGGEILSGQGTNSISVRWHLEDFGSVAVTESNNQCSSQEVSINVALGVDNLPDNISIARLWNEALLEAIRDDFARPTVHARNLFHTSVAMYDIWAIYDDVASPYLVGNTVNGFTSVLEELIPNEAIDISLHKAISYAMYRLLTHRFQNSPGVLGTQARFDLLMEKLGYDITITSLLYEDGDSAALGNFVAQTIINYGLQDGSREATRYDNEYYEPVNVPYALNPIIGSFNLPINDPNRWQPLALEIFIDQGGVIIDDDTPPFLSPEWGNVFSFALSEDDRVTYQRGGHDYRVFHDPSDPPYINLSEPNASSDAYKWGFSMVSVWQSHLDPNDGVMWDISPNSIGNVDISTFPADYEDYPNFYNFFEGGANSNGHNLNPVTGNPYETKMVPRGDYARVLAEFWADGPESETPPGHWFTILNYVNDHPQFEKRFQGEGDILNPLEWDVKAYFILGGGMHDAAISAWSVKGWYDYIRPISAIRSMAERGQSTDNTLDNYHVGGIPLIDNYIEVVEVGDPLAGSFNQNLDKIKLYTWRGHDFINNTEIDQAGVGWILAEDWYPYQRPTFVTPPFAGYVSGHSTYSRAAAELMTKMTGSPFFPGGLGEFTAKANEFLVFEEGPSQDVILQWATYRDASDQTSLSRIWGGIHPPADDIPGRFIGQAVAEDVFDFAVPYFEGSLSYESLNEPIKIYPNPTINKEIFIDNTNGRENIEVFDMQGKRINLANRTYDESNNTTSLKFYSTASGLYLLKVGDTSKMVVVNN